MTKLKISFCMATRNRAHLIGETLDSIIQQATDEVEIIVLDGASTDNTGEVVVQRQKSFPRLRYVRQDANQGVDHDFAEAVRFADGEYCWLFSDDDLLRPGAIQAVLDAIEKRFSLVIVNAECRDANQSRVLRSYMARLTEDKVYTPGENHRFFADIGHTLSFIGCVVIDRHLWNERDKETYYGSYFVHVGVIFQAPLPRDTLVIARPLVSIRYGVASWLEKSFEIWMFKWPGLIWSFQNYPDSIKREVCRREPWRRYRTLVFRRGAGVYTLNAYRKWIRPNLHSWWRRALSKAIALIPGQIANMAALAGLVLFRRGHGYELEFVDQVNSPFYFLRRKRASQTGGGSRDERTRRISGALSSVPLGKKDGRAI